MEDGNLILWQYATPIRKLLVCQRCADSVCDTRTKNGLRLLCSEAAGMQPYLNNTSKIYCLQMDIQSPSMGCGLFRPSE